MLLKKTYFRYLKKKYLRIEMKQIILIVNKCGIYSINIIARFNTFSQLHTFKKMFNAIELNKYKTININKLFLFSSSSRFNNFSVPSNLLTLFIINLLFLVNFFLNTFLFFIFVGKNVILIFFLLFKFLKRIF